MYILVYLCVFVREENISQQWKDLLQQLHDQRGLLGNVAESLSVLRDIELVSQELKELQVSHSEPITTPLVFKEEICVCKMFQKVSVYVSVNTIIRQ